MEGGASTTFCTSTIDQTVITAVAYIGNGEEDGFTRTFTFSGETIPAPAIWIRYKDSDFDVSVTTSPSSSSSSTSLPSSGTQTFSPTNNPSSSPAPSHNNLSTGAKIGLGLGIPLAVILAVVGFAFIFIRRRKQRRFAERAGNKEGGSGCESRNPDEWVRPKSELPAGDVNVITSVGRSELDASGAASGLLPSELEAGVPREAHGG